MHIPETFETERLILRPTGTEDAEFILELLNTPKWSEYIGDRGVRTVDQAKDYIQERMIPQLERLGFSNYTVIRKSDGEKLGCSGLYDREGLEGVDIGFAFLPQFEGLGYAYESSLKVKQIGIEFFGISHIKAITIESNIKSQKLLEKLGLKFVKFFRMEGDDAELMLYEWNSLVK